MRLIIFLTIFLTSSAFSSSPPSNVIKIGISSAPTNLNPFFSTDGNSQNILRLVHTSLIDFDDSMKVVCRLCENYKEWMDKKQHHIRFKLKKNIHFSDDTKVNASSIKKAHQYFTDSQKIKSIFRFAFSKIKHIKVHNEFDVELVFNKYDLSNLTNLALFKIVKINNYKQKNKIEHSDIIGAGEYQFHNINEMSIELTDKKKKLEKLKFIVVKDETTLALKLINSEIDLSLANISPRKLLWLKKNNLKSLSFKERSGSNYKYLGINHENEFLKSSKIRRALTYLLPIDKLIKYKLKNTAGASSGFFSNAFVDYNRKYKDLYNPKKAKKLLSEMGFMINKNGVYEKNNIPLSFVIKTSNNKSTKEIASVISDYFKREGVDVEVKTSEWGSFMRALKAGQFDMILGQWIGFVGPEMLKSTFHTDSIPPKGLNRGRFKNQLFDKYIDISVNSIKKSMRIKYYNLAMDVLDLEVPYINLWHPNIIWISQKCIKLPSLYPNGSYLPLLGIESNCDKKEL